ncbi:488_t:CDS:2, partial [Dentiscutata erythropus]
MCGKPGYTKKNCLKVRKTKKINNITSSQYEYIGQSQSEKDIEYIINESDQEESSQEESNQENKPNNYATISCKVYDLEIPHVLLDTGLDGSHISENIANYFIKYFGLKIDRKKVYRLTGAVGEKQSIGTFSDIPVTIGIGNDTLIVSDKFSVLPTEKDSNSKDISLFIL